MLDYILFSWSAIGTENPLENSKETVFFKTIQMAHADQGWIVFIFSISINYKSCIILNRGKCEITLTIVN